MYFGPPWFCSSLSPSPKVVPCDSIDRLRYRLQCVQTPKLVTMPLSTLFAVSEDEGEG